MLGGVLSIGYHSLPFRKALTKLKLHSPVLQTMVDLRDFYQDGSGLEKSIYGKGSDKYPGSKAVWLLNKS